MKKFLTLCVLLSFPFTAYAATKVSTPSATPKTTVQSKIDDLKERLATKVAELRKVTPKAIAGTVTQISVSSMTVDAMQKAYKIELTDDIVVIQILKGKRTTLTIDDIDKNDSVTIFGDYDATLDVMQAKKIFIEGVIPKRIHGFIKAINKKDNSFTLTGIDNTEYSIDVESTTKNNMWTSADGIIKSGFSKLETGMFVTVVGNEDPKNADSYTAQRILTMKVAPAGTTPTIAPTKEATPTATIKVTPTKKPTAVPTKRVTPKVTTTP